MESVEVVHFIPGRVRLRIKDLKTMPALAEQVRSAFAGVPGIRCVDIKALTGSVVVEYDAGAIRCAESLDALSKALSTLFPASDVPKLLAWIVSSH